MYLKRIAIINYKSCRDMVLDLDSDSPNTFIGQTDAGKSTILKAIGLLLNEKSSPNMLREGHETSDISTTSLTNERYEEIFNELGLTCFEPGDEKSIIIAGIFGRQEGDFDGEFDDIASNHLKWSIESHSTDELPILRQFNNQYPNGRYLLCSMEDVSDKKELWKETQVALDTLVKNANITSADITNVNQSGRFKKIEKFRAIYSKLRTSMQWSTYDDFAKKDRSFFPIYRYIDWREITLKTVEELARDTMSTVIEEYATKLRELAERLGKEATEKVNRELESKTSEILSGLPSVSAIRARVFFNANETISEISVEKGSSDGEVLLDSQGDGVKKQIGFAFMRLSALENVPQGMTAKKFLWGFDEPETHLYPPEKRDFYEIIKQLSKGVFQTFISTHSTVFVDKSQIETIRKVQLVDKYTTASMCTSVSDVHSSLGMRNSDFLFYDIFIAGEGSSDEILVPFFYKLYFDRTFEDDSIQFVSLGGESKRAENQKLFEQMMKDFKDPNDCVYYVLDNDTGATGNNVYLVGTFDIEDSIDNKYWLVLVKDKCGIDLSDDDLNDIRSKLTPDKNKKFHKLLSDRVAQEESKSGYLPSKTDCAVYMKEYIKDKNDIPSGIVKLFDNISENAK